MVQADIVAELDRIWLTATLATNVNLEILLHLTALFECDTHQLANACEIDGLEGILLEDVSFDVLPQKGAIIIMPDPQACLGEVDGAKGKGLGVLSDLVGCHNGAGQFDHGAHHSKICCYSQI